MTPLQREAFQMCLEYIETDAHERRHVRWKINEALAQPQPEPVAWRVKWPAIGGGHNWLMVDLPLMEKEGFVNEALYTSPPARKPLTDEEIETVWRSVQANDFHDCVKPFARAIEAAHGIKGEA